MKRLIDLDEAIKDARLNYGGVRDAVLMEHFLKSQPVVTPTAELDRSRWKGCPNCHRWQTYGYENYKPAYCRDCGKPLNEQAWAELERRINGGTAD